MKTTTKKGLQKAWILYGCRLLVLQRDGQQEGEQLNQVLHYPKYTYPQKRPNIWKFKIVRVKETRPPCKESRRLPMASTVKKPPTSVAFIISVTYFILYSPWRAFQHQNGGQGEEKGV